MTESINMIKQAGNHHSVNFTHFPLKGIGERAMGCKMYDKCLYKAAVNDWYSFNCEGCNYEDRDYLEFIDSAFMPEFEEPDLTPEEDLEMELVDLSVNFPSIFYLQEALESDEYAA